MSIISSIKRRMNITHESALQSVSLSIIVLLIWISLWSILGKDALPPNGSIFAFAVLFIVAYISGEIISLVSLPPLLGMLISGFIIANCFQLNIDKKLSSILRSTALIIILIRAGLGLDPTQLRRLSGVCMRLAFTPCIVEAIVVAVCSYLLLDFPLVWGFLLGFVLAAVSPAVVVPAMIQLQENRLGTDKGIPTLVTAAASVDDVLAITGFGVCLGIAFNTSSSLVWSISKGPLEAVSGLIFGSLIGILLWYIPSKPESIIKQSNYHMEQRIAILLLSGVVALFGSSALNFGGAGALACLTLSFVAALKLRSNKCFDSMQSTMKIVWLIFQPFLFVLIGAEVKLSNLKGNAIELALVSLVIGLIARLLASVSVLFNANLNIKEKLFIAIAWLPKATVQAAVGPLALDLARNDDNQTNIELATTVLTIAVLSILITAPLGAFAIALFAPKLLNKNDESIKSENENEMDVKVESEM